MPLTFQSLREADTERLTRREFVRQATQHGLDLEEAGKKADLVMSGVVDVLIGGKWLRACDGKVKR